MKPTVRLMFALGIAGLATSSASAHGCKTMKMRAYPMQMAPVAYPMAPIGVPIGGAGMGFRMEMNASGEMAALMVPLLARIAERILGPAQPGMSEARFRELAKDLAKELVKEGLDPTSAPMRLLLDAIRKAATGKDESNTSLTPISQPAASSEFQKAKAEVEKLVKEIQAIQAAPSAPVRAAKNDPRAEIKRLLAEIKAVELGKGTPASTPVASGK